MKQGKYPAEFRIQEYKAWPHPDAQSETHKTSPYSLRDNPTGISVKDGEQLMIFVGDTHGADRYVRLSIDRCTATYV